MLKKWVWNGIAVQAPEDWELLRFSLNAERGGVFFADRYQYRFQLNWNRLAGAPDFERMLANYRDILTSKHGLEKVTELRHGDGWRGLGGMQEDTRIVRFGKFFPSRSLLLEAVWLDPGKQERELCGAMLDTIDIPAQEGDTALWQCFGMRMDVPRELSPKQCIVQPARVAMEFTNRPGRISVAFSRLGLVDLWMRSDLEEWLKRCAPGKILSWEPLEIHRSSHRGISVSAVCRAGNAVLRRKIWAAEAWRCTRDGRLYTLMRTGTLQASENAALRCCDGD